MTDRIMVYPGAIPLETDLLYSNKFSMMGLAKLAATMMGSTTYLHGLQCTPSSPASMIINVAKGQIYSLQNVDNTNYSSLAADTVNTILKQGIILSSTAFTLIAPTIAGQSINYLIQVTYTDTDTGATVLPYYNAANPSVAYSGPNNSGAAQNTVRSGVCTISLKAGVAATTGTQTTPAADSGYTAAWVITVAQGATTVTSTNISVAANAPFLPSSGLVSAIQQCTMTYAADTGAANAYVAQFLPALPTLSDGMRLTFKAKVANTGTSTFAANGGSAYPIYSHANQALQGGEIIANGLIEVEWNSSLTAWILCGNSGGATPVATATQTNQAVNLAQLNALIASLTLGTASTRNVGTGTNQIPDMSSFASSSAAPGYFKLPSGIIVQWGSATTGSDGSIFATYPIAFPSSVFIAVCTNQGNFPTGPVAASLGGLVSVRLSCLNSSGTGVSGVSISYLVIGH